MNAHFSQTGNSECIYTKQMNDSSRVVADRQYEVSEPAGQSRRSLVC